MPRRIAIEQARDLVRSRDELLYSGATDRELRTRVLSGSLRRVHRGFYVDGAVWDDLRPQGRQMVRLLAVNRAADDDGPVFSHTSAAVLWDLPLFGRTADLVHVVIQGRGHTRTEAGVRRHDMEIAEKDIVRRHGLRCTSMVRTVFDLARTLSAEAALSAADASARTVAVRGSRIDADADSTWREELRSLCSPGLRGVRRARWVSEFADGRAQLPGEREPTPARQTRVPRGRSAGARGRFRRHALLPGFRLPSLPRFRRIRRGGKYLESGLRTAPTTSDVVPEEKRREDDVRGMTGWRLVRWGSPHIRTPELLGSRLAAFGIRPPG